MRNFIRAILSVLLFVQSSGSAMAEKQPEEIVVLLHGIGHAEWNMAGIEFALRKAGYKTLNIGYPSLTHNLDGLADRLHAELQKEKVWDNSKVHFATHSMGGLVARTYFSTHKDKIPQDRLGRVVMLAPPHGGSEVADLLQDFPPYQWAFGPAGQELTTAQQIQAETEVYYDLGIIAGNKEWPYIVAAHVIPNESDGRVALEKTKLPGMKDHITISATHSFISWKPSVHKQIIYFLKHGKFQHAG